MDKKVRLVCSCGDEIKLVLDLEIGMALEGTCLGCGVRYCITAEPI